MRGRRGVALLIACVLGLGGCQMSPAPVPEPSSTPADALPIVVMGTDPIRTTDPAAVVGQGDSILNLNVFQRLMTTEPGQTALKPDAARDCVFTGSTIYTCTLNDKTVFHNGHPLTSSDVKFSILRTRRLGVPGSSAAALSNLARIETPDPLTVRFVLHRVDTQFGFAIASPAASIVDEQVYPADRLRTAREPIIGSGPFSVVTFTGEQLVLKRNQSYIGKNTAQAENLVYQVAADSAALEAAVTARTVDIVGRGLSSAALVRYQGQLLHNGNQLTDAGYRIQSQSGTRIRMLMWSSAAAARVPYAARDAVEEALRADRTSDSVVPGGVLGHIGAVPIGGRPRPQISWKRPIPLTLGYDTTMPDGRDVADQVSSRLEATKGFTVTLEPGATDADLTVVDRKAWTATGGAWLQPYLSAPPDATAALVSALWTRYVGETVESEALTSLASLQRQAAIDATVVPMTQSDETFLVRDGTTLPPDSFGPGWQLGFFWVRRG